MGPKAQREQTDRDQGVTRRAWKVARSSLVRKSFVFFPTPAFQLSCLEFPQEKKMLVSTSSHFEEDMLVEVYYDK